MKTTQTMSKALELVDQDWLKEQPDHVVLALKNAYLAGMLEARTQQDEINALGRVNPSYSPKRHYKMLETILKQRKIYHKTVAEWLGIHNTSVSMKFTGRYEFSQEEKMIILEKLGIKKELHGWLFPIPTNARPQTLAQYCKEMIESLTEALELDQKED